jgi:hypothetical protein
MLCEGCGRHFITNKSYQRFCSEKCCKATYKTNWETRVGTVRYGLPSATVGAVNELRVATDLMLRGFHVFRALSPACPCDLAVLTTDNRLIRIEVKTASKGLHGQTYRPHIKLGKECTFDVLAIVTREAITYEPDLTAGGLSVQRQLELPMQNTASQKRRLWRPCGDTKRRRGVNHAG